MSGSCVRVCASARLSRRSCRAFTLLELMIVVAIIGVLLALLMGAVQRGWECAYDVQCKTNLNRLHQALHMGRDSILPDPCYWVGFVETVGAQSALLCPIGDSCLPDAVEAMKKRIPPPVTTGYSEEDTILPPPDTSSLPDQNMALVDPPVSVIIGSKGAFENSTTIRAFREREDFTLPTSVRVNIVSPGYYDSYATMTGGSVGAGRRVNSYFVHYDPVASGPGLSSGSLTFPGEVLGIACRDAELDASDGVLGHPGTAYPTGTKSRGFENSGQEIVSVSKDGCTVVVHRYYSTGVGEQMRVIVACEKKDDQNNPIATLPEDKGWGSDGGWEPVPRCNVGGPTSYGMNNQVTTSGAWSGQILLVEYRRALVDVNGEGLDDNLGDLLAPRHAGFINVLFVDGEVRGMLPEELVSVVARNLWKPRVKDKY